MMRRRDFLKCTAAGAAGGLLGGTRGAFAAAPAVGRPGGELTTAIFADPLTFDPHIAGNIQGRAAAQAIHDTLLTIDEAGRLAPALAEAWEYKDNRTIEVRLRRGVKFHDDTVFDAEAVRYNIERIRNPDTGSIRGGEISTLDTVEVLDSHTLRFNLKVPFAAFLFPFTDVAGCMASPTALERWGKDYALNPAGTGPFRLAEYLKDSRTVLEKNGTYWREGRPFLDRVVLRPVPTDSTRLAELRSGGVDFVEALPLQDIPRLREAGEFVVSEKVGFRWEYFGFNLRDAYPGHAKKFRQAFQWAIDREALHQVAYFGTGSIGYDGILPGSPFHDTDYKPFTLDMNRAKRLIEESGLETPITLVAPLQSDPVKQRAAQVFQATASELGVKVQLEQVDTAGYRAALGAGTMPCDLQGWWGYRPDPDQYLAILLHSSGSYAKRHGYSNPEMDKLIDAERAEVDEGRRRAIFRQISDLMNEDAVYVPWHYSSDFKGLHPKVKGFVHYQDSIVRYEDLSIEA